MKRIEIIMNRAIVNVVLSEVAKEFGRDMKYSLIPNIQGQGFSGSCLGDEVWPELNDIVILYLEDEKVEALVDHMKSLKKHFPLQGLAMFQVENAVSLL